MIDIQSKNGNSKFFLLTLLGMLIWGLKRSDKIEIG